MYNKTYKIVFFCLILILLFVNSINSHSKPEFKLKASLFDFVTSAVTNNESIKKMLEMKIRSLLGEFSHKENDYKYLEDFRIIKIDKDPPSSISESLLFWRESESLFLISGAISSSQDNNILTSELFFGDLGLKLKRKFINVQLTVTPTQYRTFRDSHSAVILYCLAMDAKRIDNSKVALISGYLGEALSIMKDIPEDHGLKLLKNEIIRELQKLNEK